jgi:hypothetical protein
MNQFKSSEVLRLESNNTMCYQVVHNSKYFKVLYAYSDVNGSTVPNIVENKFIMEAYLQIYCEKILNTDYNQYSWYLDPHNYSFVYYETNQTPYQKALDTVYSNTVGVGANHHYASIVYHIKEKIMKYQRALKIYNIIFRLIIKNVLELLILVVPDLIISQINFAYIHYAVLTSLPPLDITENCKYIIVYYAHIGANLAFQTKVEFCDIDSDSEIINVNGGYYLIIDPSKVNVNTHLLTNKYKNCGCSKNLMHEYHNSLIVFLIYVV